MVGRSIQKIHRGRELLSKSLTPKQDPELWFDEGNCFVHLYGKGQSRRGPAFRVPLSAILEANCHRLVSRYRLRTVAEQTSTESTHGSQDGSDAAGKVDLYIPPPPMADKKQIVDFYLAMRNLFAWMCRKSVVGEHLGSALIVLMDNMREFRSPGVDNVEDVLDYVAYEGYLDMANQPIHALAMVHLAEHYQLRDLYINAFAHCAGMGDCLYGLPEYQVCPTATSSISTVNLLLLGCKLRHEKVATTGSNERRGQARQSRDIAQELPGGRPVRVEHGADYRRQSAS
jgi:hypothetical protein